ncbi:response regulator [bacterium]|nr:response regulator [bacterium]
MTSLSLRGLRILVVEDNFVLADALRYLLAGYDGIVTAIAPTVERARAALAAEPVDVAVLDINLNGASVVPFAEELRAAGVPFVFVTGYGDDPELLPAHLRTLPRLEKPVEAERLVGLLLDLTARPRPSS